MKWFILLVRIPLEIMFNIFASSLHDNARYELVEDPNELGFYWRKIE